MYGGFFVTWAEIGMGLLGNEKDAIDRDYGLRIAKTEDAGLLADLGQQTFIEAFGNLYGVDDLAMFLAESHCKDAYTTTLRDPHRQIWIAEHYENGPVGFAVTGPSTLPVPQMPESAGELQRLYLLENAQNAGLGGRLMDKAMAWLIARFDHLYISVYSENFGAQRFYQRYGFRKIHDYHFMVGNQADPEFIYYRPAAG